jgi:hypothetical protein
MKYRYWPRRHPQKVPKPECGAASQPLRCRCTKAYDAPNSTGTTVARAQYGLLIFPHPFHRLFAQHITEIAVTGQSQTTGLNFSKPAQIPNHLVFIEAHAKGDKVPKHNLDPNLSYCTSILNKAPNQDLLHSCRFPSTRKFHLFDLNVGLAAALALGFFRFHHTL